MDLVSDVAGGGDTNNLLARGEMLERKSAVSCTPNAYGGPPLQNQADGGARHRVAALSVYNITGESCVADGLLAATTKEGQSKQKSY